MVMPSRGLTYAGFAGFGEHKTERPVASVMLVAGAPSRWSQPQSVWRR
jgi:hypothetical protein